MYVTPAELNSVSPFVKEILAVVSGTLLIATNIFIFRFFKKVYKNRKNDKLTKFCSAKLNLYILFKTDY
jgi:hypothetical protein